MFDEEKVKKILGTDLRHHPFFVLVIQNKKPPKSIRTHQNNRMILQSFFFM
jgi:hypothetical protein